MTVRDLVVLYLRCWGFNTHGMWRWIFLKVVSDVSKDRVYFIFKCNKSMKRIFNEPVKLMDWLFLKINAVRSLETSKKSSSDFACLRRRKLESAGKILLSLKFNVFFINKTFFFVPVNKFWVTYGRVVVAVKSSNDSVTFTCTFVTHQIHVTHEFTGHKIKDFLYVYSRRHSQWFAAKNQMLRWRSWLRHCATNLKVAGSIPDGVSGFFHWHNPVDCTMALGSTQPLTEMSTKNISWGVKAAGA
jgi:hypothetical protein